jgi:hypothetical protein
VVGYVGVSSQIKIIPHFLCEFHSTRYCTSNKNLLPGTVLSIQFHDVPGVGRNENPTGESGAMIPKCSIKRRLKVGPVREHPLSGFSPTHTASFTTMAGDEHKTGDRQ